MLAAFVDHRYEARFRLALIWGLRPGEATGLTWERVDFVRGTIEIAAQLQRSKIAVNGEPLGTIHRAGTKSTAGARTIWRLLELWKDAQAAEMIGRELAPFQIQHRAQQAARLAAAKDLGLLVSPGLYSVPPADGLVFTLANGDPILPRWDADMWTALCNRAGIKHVRLYVARHTAINHMLRSGAPLASVSVAAGHHSQAFTERVYGGNRDVIGDGLAAFVSESP
jgi:integrase